MKLIILLVIISSIRSYPDRQTKTVFRVPKVTHACERTTGSKASERSDKVEVIAPAISLRARKLSVASVSAARWRRTATCCLSGDWYARVREDRCRGRRFDA